MISWIRGPGEVEEKPVVVAAPVKTTSSGNDGFPGWDSPQVDQWLDEVLDNDERLTAWIGKVEAMGDDV